MIGVDYFARWSTDPTFVEARNTIRALVASMLRVLGAALDRVDDLAGPDLAATLAEDELLESLRVAIEMHSDVDVHQRGDQIGFADIERLIGEAERIAAPEARDRARDATTRSIRMIRDGLARVGELVGPVLARRLADDELVGMLHVLAGTHPDAPEVRTRRALEAATAELGSLSVRLVAVIGPSGRDVASTNGADASSSGANGSNGAHVGATSTGATAETEIGEIKPTGASSNGATGAHAASSNGAHVGATPETEIGEIKPTGSSVGAPNTDIGEIKRVPSNRAHGSGANGHGASSNASNGAHVGATSNGETAETDIGEIKSTGVTVRLSAERGAKIDDARVRGLVEMIVMTRAPDLEGLRVEIEGLVVADPDFVPLGRLRPSQAHERCSLCARPIGATHDHLYAPAKREIVCACDGCAHIIPSSEYAAYRRVRRDVRRVEVADIAGWLDRLNVPVGVAALIRDDRGGARLAYPGPAGLVEANVDPAIWAALCDAVPDAAQLAPEVEALVWSGLTREVLRTGIDVVFRLVGELRKHWRGITGGDGPAALSRVLAEIVEGAA